MSTSQKDTTQTEKDLVKDAEKVAAAKEAKAIEKALADSEKAAGKPLTTSEKEAIKAVVHAEIAAGRALNDAEKAAIKGFTDAEKAAAKALIEAGNAIVNAENAAGRALTKAEKAAVKALSDAEVAVGRALTDAEKAAIKGFTDAEKSAAFALNVAGRVLYDAEQAAGRALSKAEKAVVKALTDAEVAAGRVLSDAEHAAVKGFSDAEKAAAKALIEAGKKFRSFGKAFTEALEKEEACVANCFGICIQAIEDDVQAAKDVVSGVAAEEARLAEKAIKDAEKAAGHALTEAEKTAIKNRVHSEKSNKELDKKTKPHEKRPSLFMERLPDIIDGKLTAKHFETLVDKELLVEEKKALITRSIEEEDALVGYLIELISKSTGSSKGLWVVKGIKKFRFSATQYLIENINAEQRWIIIEKDKVVAGKPIIVKRRVAVF